jgi:putative protease
MSHWVPELLAPAGSLEKLKVAVLYGADAVYLGGQKFGLRTAAENLTYQELEEAVAFAHERSSKVFVVLNSFLHDQDLDELPEFIKFLNEIQVDAVIISDLGVVRTFRKLSSIPIHLSTQASCLNVESAKFWKKMGVQRIVLGREVGLKEASEIKRETGLEIELFIHGSMCMAYSGNCVISNYTSGRDSNRGGCAHSCRFEYSLSGDGESGEKKELKSFFMSSKDLKGVSVLPEFIKYGIDSLKIEGRMKSHLYAGTTSKVYSEALSYYQEHGHFLSDDLYAWKDELNKITHREYHEGNLVQKAGRESIYSERETEEKEFVVVGIVLQVIEKNFMLVEVRSAFSPGEELELLPFEGKAIPFTPTTISNVSGEVFEKTRPGLLVKLPYFSEVKEWNILRKRVVQ